MTKLLFLPFGEIIIDRHATKRTPFDHTDTQSTHQLMSTGQKNHVVRIGKANDTLVVLLVIRVRAVDALHVTSPLLSLRAAQKSHPDKCSAGESASASDSAKNESPKSTQNAGSRTSCDPAPSSGDSPLAAL